MCKNYWWVATPCTWNFGSKWPRWCKIADFWSIFARSASAVTAVWKLSGTKLYSIHWPNLRCKNYWWGTTHFTWNFESKWIGWCKIWRISCDNSETVRVRMSVSAITNSKSHTGFRLVSTSMTLNDLERRNSLYFAFFHGIRQILGRLYHSGWR